VKAALAAVFAFLSLAAPLSAEGVTADLTLQFVMTTSFTPAGLKDDGAPLSDGYDFGRDTVNILSAEVADPASLGARFEYARGSGDWNVIGADPSPSGTTYSVVWSVAGLPTGSNYRVRAVGLDNAGNGHPGLSYSNCVVNQ
jgi:hypothetical protein